LLPPLPPYGVSNTKSSRVVTLTPGPIIGVESWIPSPPPDEMTKFQLIIKTGHWMPNPKKTSVMKLWIMLMDVLLCEVGEPARYEPYSYFISS
jgi:hypothetical protein